VIDLGYNEPGQVGMRVPTPLARHTYASENDFRQQAELWRRDEVAARRAYYGGTQLDADNNACLTGLTAEQTRTGEKMLARAAMAGKLPEHLRLHAYSAQIEESVDYLTHRLVSDFAVECKSSAVQDIIDRCLDSSPELSGTANDDELSVERVTREALLAMDCPVRVRFDVALGSCWLDFYPSDSVRLDFTTERSDRPDFAALWETHWLPGEDGHPRQVTIRREWRVEWHTYPGPDGLPDTGQMTYQCVEKWWEERPGQDEDILLDTRPTGLPFVPWGLLRGSRKGLRVERGESVVSTRAMRTADRIDSLLQRGFLAAAHNAHATLAVVGDGAMLRLERDNKIHKDVADVLTFPGGTAVLPVVLPTDTALIEHQRTVLLDALYGTFGLARVDQSTLQGLGQVTGYALEILNTRTDSTFDILRNQLVRDWLAVVNLILDCQAHWTVVTDQTDRAAVVTEALKIDPLTVYPDRAAEIRTGSGGVVDAARVRDDFVVGLISHEEALRQLGYTNDEITLIRRELDAQAQRDQQAQQAALGGVEGTGFSGAPRPGNGIVGGNNSTPPGTVGGVVNNPTQLRPAK
jgi:hypothetical protein